MLPRSSWSLDLTIAGISAMLIAPQCAGATIYVDDDAPPGGDGSSWQQAYAFLSDAMSSGRGLTGAVRIKIAQGVYRPDESERHPQGTGDRSVSFVPFEDVALLGGYAGLGAENPDEQDPVRFETILSGDLNGDDLPGFLHRSDNAYHVVFIYDPSAFGLMTLKYCTVQGGNANGGGEHSRGGGVYNKLSALGVLGCVIRDNQSSGDGGGFYIAPGIGAGGLSCNGNDFVGNKAGAGGGGLYHARPLFKVIDCTFDSNTAVGGGGLQTHVSGGHFVVGCTFINNHAIFGGGGLKCSSSGFAQISSCTFLRNTSSADGGGLQCSSKFTLNRSQFLGNSADDDGGGLFGVASEAAVANSTFIGNIAGANGGGLYANSSLPSTARNCTMIANLARIGGGVYGGSAGVQVTNSILWDNTPSQVDSTLPSAVTLAGSDVQGGWRGPGWNNIDADPLLVAAPSPGADLMWGTLDDCYGDVRLAATSLCIDAGLNNCAPRDGLSTTADFLYLDLDGEPRFASVRPADDSGCGVFAVIDMGALESLGSAAEPRRGDVDGDDHVDGIDLAHVLAAWGLGGEGCVPADVNCDGVVNGDDIELLFSQWWP